MELNFEACEVSRISWKAQIRQTITNSPSFTIQNETWCFQLRYSNQDTYNLYLILIKREARTPLTKFVITVCVRDGNRQHSLITSKEVVFTETHISAVSRNSFPGNYYIGNTVTFVVTFDYLDRSIREHKSVQSASFLDECSALGSLSLDFSKALGESSNSDVELKCGDRIYPAHKVILCARSEVFQAMLTSDMLERREGSVEISDLEPSNLEIFLKYLYTGTLSELTVDTALSLYEAGDMYHVEGLKNRCGDFLAESLTPGNACDILAMADAHSDNDLKERVLSYVLDEDIPNKEEDWSRFSDDHPKLSNEVLYRAYKRLTKSFK